MWGIMFSPRAVHTMGTMRIASYVDVILRPVVVRGHCHNVVVVLLFW